MPELKSIDKQISKAKYLTECNIYYEGKLLEIIDTQPYFPLKVVMGVS